MATEPVYAMKKAIRSLLINHTALTDLVTPNAIFDKHQRPESFPCVILGEGQKVRDNTVIARDRVECFLDLHIWAKENGFDLANQITAETWDALRGAFFSVDGHTLIDLQEEGTRFIRDPSGAHSHAVLTLSALLAES